MTPDHTTHQILFLYVGQQLFGSYRDLFFGFMSDNGRRIADIKMFIKFE
jgi:hypothetical protein